MGSTILLATGNPGKLREFERLFAALGKGHWSVMKTDVPDTEETGLSFVENARIKAVAAAKHSQAVCLGEDSGLEVDFLLGAPGIRSHRFSPSGHDEDNNELLLRKLRGVPWEKRTARYRSSICVAGPFGVLCESSGTVEGVILRARRGNFGFGYDPLFWCPEIGKSFGEAQDFEKDQVSHRRRALENILDALGQVMG